MTEVWKDIRGFAGYQASNTGRVRSKRKVLSPFKRKDGHLVACIAGTHMYVHKAVMLAFVGHRSPGQVVLHLNHQPDDNRIENLRYGTVSENLRMDFAVGTRCHKGERAPAAKLSDMDVAAIRSSAQTTSFLALAYNVSERHIRAVRSNSSRNDAAAPSSGQQHSLLGEITMAKKPALTPAEIKAQKQSLTALLKQQKEALKPHREAAATAAKALAAAKKEADKAVAAAQKTAALAATKLAKAEEAAAKGAEKINAKLAALSPATVE